MMELLVAVDELDGFLDRDDVAVEVDVDVVEQRGERGGLAGAGGAGDEHEAGAHVAEFLDDIRHAEAFERGDFGGDEPEHGGEAVLLLEVVAAEAGVLVHFVGEVEVAAFEVALEGLGIADFGEQVLESSRPSRTC